MDIFTRLKVRQAQLQYLLRNAPNSQRLRRQLSTVNLKLARFQLPASQSNAAVSRSTSNSSPVNSRLSTVRIGTPYPQVVRTPRLQIWQQEVYFRNRPQPALIFEHLVTHLFERFLRNKPPPQKIGIAFKLTTASSYFYCPLRSPLVNTYSVLAREVEIKAQSQQGVYGIQGERIIFQLSAQFPPTNTVPPTRRHRVRTRMAGACRQLRTRLRRQEIDVSDSANRWCLAYNVCAGIKLAEQPATNIQSWAAQTDLFTLAHQLLHKSGCNLHKRFYTRSDIDKIQQFLNQRFPQTFRLVVVQLNKLRYKGPPAQNVIALRFVRHHFTLIRNLAAFMGSRENYCVDCERRANRHSHYSKCKAFCPECFRFGYNVCRRDGTGLKCNKCKIYFRNRNCYEHHLKTPLRAGGHSICFHVKICSCGRKINSQHRHRCHRQVKPKTVTDDCKRCKCLHDSQHPDVCFVPKYCPKDEPKPIVYSFFDCETTQNTGKHIANYVVLQTQCANCMDANIPFNDPLPSNATHICYCPPVKSYHFENFDGLKPPPLEQFLEIVTKRRRTDAVRHILLAHNSSRFDTHLVFEAAVQMGHTPKMIQKGNKVFKMVLTGRNMQSCEFLDSYNFMLAPLAQLPKCFGLPSDLSKLYFPHLFNKPENLNRRLRQLPHRRHYAMRNRSVAENKKFNAWYEQHRSQPFCLRDQLPIYCELDVSILRQSCAVFRQTIKKEVGLDPFEVSCTIAGLTMTIYRHKFLPERTMVNTPEKGYRPIDFQSVKARKWIRWYASHHNVQIQSAESVDGEARIKVGKHEFRPDGLVRDSNGQPVKILEFLGCLPHGCLHYKNRDALLLGESTAKQLYNRTQTRIWALQKATGLPVEVIWECEWDACLAADRKLRQEVQNIELVEPINPRRDALRGGRVEPFVLHYECDPELEEILYFDICSLYPFVMAEREFPEGHPTIIVPDNRIVSWTKPEDHTYKGLIKARVIAPRNLKPALLSYRSKTNVLLFPLCGQCAEKMCLETCNHTDEQRAFWGTYTHAELNKALSLGYRVIEVAEIWHWDTWRSGADSYFAKFINLFLKMKIENSGWPAAVMEVPEGNERVRAKLEYIAEYRNRGIHLDYHKIELNPAKRFIAKILLNSLWGKYCQAGDRSEVKIVQSEEEIDKLLDSPVIEIQDILPLTPEILRITYRDSSIRKQQPITNNVPVGVFVTSYARLHLFSFMQRVGDRLLYVDTDSVIFVSRLNEPPSIPLGMYLGEMTREWDTFRILEFISAGPKNYGLKMQSMEDSSVSAVLKIRGFTQTLDTEEILSYDNIKSLIYAKIRELHGQSVDVAEPDPDAPDEMEDAGVATAEPNLLTVHYDQITRNRSGELHTVRRSKNYRFAYNKGLILPDLTVQSYGYVDE